MIKTFSSIAFAGLVLATISGCATKEAEPVAVQTQEYTSNFTCKQENVDAPRWTCIPTVEGYYAGVGVAEKSSAGMGFMRRVALANGRSDLAQQIQTQVKDKMELFTRATGTTQNETIDKVSTAVTKQVANVNLEGSKAVDVWNAPSGALYMLVTVPASKINKDVKDTIQSSFKDDNALWQQFQSKQALEALEKEFPTQQ